jgi:hypothetical protein
MKTAVASPEDGPDKKNFGIPKKDKKGLAKKTDYEYKSESMSNKKKSKAAGGTPPKTPPTRGPKGPNWPKDKDGQNIWRSREEKNPHKPMDYTKGETPKTPKSKYDSLNKNSKPKDKSKDEKHEQWRTKTPKSKEEERSISKQRTKDSQFEKSYKVVPNKLKTKEDLNKKDTPSTKKGKQ